MVRQFQNQTPPSGYFHMSTASPVKVQNASGFNKGTNQIYENKLEKYLPACQI